MPTASPKSSRKRKVLLPFDRSLKCGDIIAFSGRGRISWTIKLTTLGSISHVGIVGRHNGELCLFESTTLDDCPCLIQKKFFKGSQCHHLQQRIDFYDGRVWHYPLSAPLFDHQETRLNEFLHDTVGIPYNALDAMRSAEGLTWVESFFREADLSALFCSEWCGAALTLIEVMQTDDSARFNPNRLVRYGRKKGFLMKPTRLK